MGVGGIESPEDKADDKRLYALVEGRNIPAPFMDVVKYRILHLPSAVQSMSFSSGSSPLDVPVILSSGSPFLSQLHPSEDALFSLHFSDKLDGSMHAPRDVDGVANLKVLVAISIVDRTSYG